MFDQGSEPPQEPPELFTVEQANQLLPLLSELLQELQRDLRLATDRVEAGRLRRLAGHNGGGRKAAESMVAGGRAERHARFLEQRGILLRDVEMGLVDFPAQRSGEPIFLCWRLGESSVGYWHPRDTGFSSRREL